MLITNPALLPKVRSAKLTEDARGKPCALRLPGICNHDNSTTVFCHLPGIGKSARSKVSDIHGAYGCFACHTAIDTHSYMKHGLTATIVLDAMLRGLAETQARWIDSGLLIVPGGRIV